MSFEYLLQTIIAASAVLQAVYSLCKLIQLVNKKR